MLEHKFDILLRITFTQQKVLNIKLFLLNLHLMQKITLLLSLLCCLVMNWFINDQIQCFSGLRHKTFSFALSVIGNLGGGFICIYDVFPYFFSRVIG